MKKEEYKKLHRELWQWLADNPDKEKSDWPRWKINGGDYDVYGDCFACEFFKDVLCHDCDLYIKSIIISGEPVCQNNGFYGQWKLESIQEQRSALALQIKDLW